MLEVFPALSRLRLPSPWADVSGTVCFLCDSDAFYCVSIVVLLMPLLFSALDNRLRKLVGGWVEYLFKL